MEGPGGYQLFGRTIQVWNSYGRGSEATAREPWLLRFFDQIRFFPVSHEELQAWRRDFPFGRKSLAIESSSFRLADYRRFLAENRTDIDRFQADRQAAFETERAQWERSKEFARADALAAEPAAGSSLPPVAPEGCEFVESPVNGIVWKVHVHTGQRVEQGETLVTIEAMKMQYEVRSEQAGVVHAVYAEAAQAVRAGSALLAIELAPAKSPTALARPLLVKDRTSRK